MDRLASLEPNPEQQASNSELRSLLEEAVERLPDAYRVIFMLRDVCVPLRGQCPRNRAGGPRGLASPRLADLHEEDDSQPRREQREGGDIRVAAVELEQLPLGVVLFALFVFSAPAQPDRCQKNTDTMRTMAVMHLHVRAVTVLQESKWEKCDSSMGYMWLNRKLLRIAFHRRNRWRCCRGDRCSPKAGYVGNQRFHIGSIQTQRGHAGCFHLGGRCFQNGCQLSR